MLDRIQSAERPPVDLKCAQSTFSESQYWGLCADNAGCGRRSEDRLKGVHARRLETLYLALSRSLDADKTAEREQRAEAQAAEQNRIIGVAQLAAGAAGCLFAVAGAGQ